MMDQLGYLFLIATVVFVALGGYFWWHDTHHGNRHAKGSR